MAQDKDTQQAQSYTVPKGETLTCPMPGMSKWNWHPKIFLPIEKTGRIVCPYCGTEYHWEGHEDAPLTQVFD